VHYRQDLICEKDYNISIVFLPFAISFIPSFSSFLHTLQNFRLFATEYEAWPPSRDVCINMNSGNTGLKIGDCYA
jgi:hypothetical protein